VATTRDVGGREGGARAVAGWYLHRGGIDEADKGAGDIDCDVFRTEEPGVIATVPDEELALLEVRSHRRGGKMEGECVRDNKHGRCVHVDEGQIAYELSLNDCADVREIGAKMVDVADGSAGGDGSLDLAEVLLEFP
jgi:hypothetical protein